MSERARKAGQFAGAVERLAGALAVEYNKFLRKLEAEGRSKYTIGELADEVVLPIWKL